MSRPLHPNTLLGIHLSTTCSRNQYETDTDPDTLTAAGTNSRRDGERNIEAPDKDALRAQVPDGWILLHVRNV